MKTIEFEEQNLTIAADQSEYETIHAHRHVSDEKGTVTFCWAFEQWEIDQINETGALWHQISTFGKALQPQRLMVDKPVLLENPKTDKELLAEKLARRIHDSRERLAPEHGCLREDELGPVEWESLPERKRSLLIAVALDILDNQ